MLEVDLCGRFEVRRDGDPVPSSAFGGRQAQQLVRMLAVQQGRLVTRDALIDALWSDLPADPDANLNVLVNRARRALGSVDTIVTAASGYLLAEVIDVDVTRFDAAVTALGEARHEPAALLAACRVALAEWRGEPLLEDGFADWARPHRERLRQQHQEVLEDAAESALAVGDVASARGWAQEAATLQPLRERSVLLQVRALAASGDVAGALQQYDALRRRLADELGIDPSPIAVALQAQLLRREEEAPRTADAPAPLVGRDRELTTLSRVGSPGVVALVTAPSGGGKSRLLAEALERCGTGWLSARAVPPEQDAPWSLARRILRAALAQGASTSGLPARGLAALTDALPELAVSADEVVLDAPSRRALVLDAARSVLASSPVRLVVVDDLQWADASSLDLLSLLAHDDTGSLLLACRSEEVLTEPTAAFLDELRTLRGLVELRLGPLDQTSVRRLVTDPEVATVIADGTAGTPFEVLEVLRALEHQDVVRRDAGGHWVRAATQSPATLDLVRSATRAGRQRAVATRAARRSPDARRVLSVLAVLGRPADLDLLARAAPEADVPAALRELGGASLVRLEPTGWSPAHDLVGEALREQLAPEERSALHLLLARALDAVPATAAERAHHLAGAGDAAAAATTYAEAARARLDACADAEALALAQAGLELAPSGDARTALLTVRGEVRGRAGDRAGARQDLRDALAASQHPDERSRLLGILALLAGGAEDMIRAEQLAELAVVEAGTLPEARAHALRVAAIVDMNLDRPERAAERYADALGLFREAGNSSGVADVLDAQAMATFMRGRVGEAIDAFGRVASLFEDLGQLLRVLTPRSTAGHALVFAGEPGAGLEHIDSSLELSRSLASREGQAYAGWHRAEALAALDRADEASAAASQALRIAQDIGHRGWTATGHRAVGIAAQAAGDLDGAEAAFRASLALSDNLSLFGSWALSRLAMVAVAQGRAAEGRRLAEQALRTGPPLAHHEARVAVALAAVALGAADAGELVTDALDAAAAGGFRALLTLLPGPEGGR